jgi:hypothetical protein
MDAERWLDERLHMLQVRTQMGELALEHMPEKIRRSMFTHCQ